MSPATPEYIDPNQAATLIELVSTGLMSIDEVRVFMGLQPWGLPETSDPIRLTQEGITHLGHTDQIEDAVKAESRRAFEGRLEGKTACHHCGGLHGWVAGLHAWQQPCPRIKKVVRNGDGQATDVEYWPPGTWERGIIFPDDVFDEDEND